MGGWADKICKVLKDLGKEKQQGTKQEVGREERTRTRKQISKRGKTVHVVFSAEAYCRKWWERADPWMFHIKTT